MASVNFNLVQKFFSRPWQESEMSYQTDETENIWSELLKIIIWDDPKTSCLYVLIVNFIFCLIFLLDLKLYGIICTILLIITCGQLHEELYSRFYSKVEPNFQNLTSHSFNMSNQRLLGFPKSSFFGKCLNKLSDTYVKAKHLRRSQPGPFCVLTSLCFLVIGIVGKLFPSASSLYWSVMAVMILPAAVVRLLPPNAIEVTWGVINLSRRGDDDSDDELGQYLMDPTEEALKVLDMAGTLQLPSKEEDEESNDLLLDQMSVRTDDTIESSCSKFLPEPELAFMPSPENSLELWESDVSNLDKPESSENQKNDINFQSQHFDGDSSDEEFVKGLNLSEKKEHQESDPELTVENLISSGKKILDTQLNPQSPTGNDRESSSDTDSFELISEGEM